MAAVTPRSLASGREPGGDALAAGDESRASGESRTGGRDAAIRTALAVLAGMAFAASALRFGFYDSSLWQPAALIALALCLALVLWTRQPPSGLQACALLGLVALWLWAYASHWWGESADQALTEANRLALYAAIFGVLLLLARRDDRISALLLAALAGTVLVVLAWIVGRMLAGSGDELFLRTRLNDPIGYINGQANYLLLAFWPLVALAERVHRPLRSGLAAAGASLVLGVTFMAQSRGSVLALVGSAAILLLVVPGRRRRAWLVLLAAGSVAVALPWLADVFRDTDAQGLAQAEVIRRAAAAALISSAAAGMLWGLAAFGARALSPGRGASDRRVEAASGIALALTVAVLGGAGLVYADRIADRASAQWTAFVNLGNSGGQGNARLISGGGNRYDYWRIAWRAFADQPVAGLGAGNYDRVYFRERRTSEAVLQAHSVELQTLSELGLVGGIALAAFVGSVLVGLLVRARRARTSRRERQLSVAAGGIFLVWLVHTSVDWMHLIPGLTAIALAAAAVLVSPPRRGRPRRVSSLARPLLGAAAVLAICLASFSIARSALAERELSTARDELGRAPVSALRHANSALRYNDQSVPAWRLRAAALARLDLYRPARESLLIATEREPSDWVTWALLGDLAVRRGDVGAARAAYRRALALNPREPSLPGLVRDPPSALAGSGG